MGEEPEAENDEIKAQSEEGEIELNGIAGSESSKSPKPENLVDEGSEPMQNSNKGEEHKMTKYKVLGSEKYKPENGFQELDAVALDLVHSLITFESNVLQQKCMKPYHCLSLKLFLEGTSKKMVISGMLIQQLLESWKKMKVVEVIWKAVHLL